MVLGAIVKKIVVKADALHKGAKFISLDEDGMILNIHPAGGGILLPQLIDCSERYFNFFIEALVDHSVPLELKIKTKNGNAKSETQVIRFGLMPRFRTLICIDLTWLDGRILFPGHTAGELKVVRHGGRVLKEDIAQISLEAAPSYHDMDIRITELSLSDERPNEFPIPDDKLIDEFGQYRKKDWPGKVKSLDELKSRLQEALDIPCGFGNKDWTAYGGWKKKRLNEGTGFFGKAKVDGRWWLTDPEGYAFFSIGPCCVVTQANCRVDGIEKLMDWLPSPDDPEYSGMYANTTWGFEIRPNITQFSFEQANLYRALGPSWYDKWSSLMINQLKANGLNTLANWSDRNLFGKTQMPYVSMLNRFPQTQQCIFRDFPDVLSAEYAQDAEICAECLLPYAKDPYMIGYFLRNEPSWAFVDNLILADEVLYKPEPSACKDRLLEFLKEKYASVQALSKAWNRRFESFDDLRTPISRASALSPQAEKDLREFSRVLLNAYVSIPSKACRKAAPRHLNLGMRWAWISDPDLISGWENFDVFSINCYALDPTAALDNVVKLGVDLPVMIGEYHFGALDTGLTATGLEGVRNQRERGKAYRYYTERVAAHPHGVGCHWFQCYDQFALGRFDGENCNIGLFDICSLPNEILMKAVRDCGELIYQIAQGSMAPVREKPEQIPMIMY
jgi:hypothetical protein